MTSKFSIDNRELLQRISSGEAVVGIDFGYLIVRELAAFRLAAMDSESVGTLSVRHMSYSGKKIGNQFGFVHSDAAMTIAEGDYPLYRHAQQQVVLDGFSVERLEMLADRLTTRITSLEIHERTGNISSTQQETLDAFRIALEVLELKRAQPAAPQSPGSEPATVPGKWIPVSELMPELDVRVLLYFSDYGGHIEDGCIGDEGDGPYHYFFDGDALSHEPTHWMPLPAAPQEGK